MKQFQFSYENDDNLLKSLNKIKQWCNSSVTSAVFFRIYTESLDKTQIINICDIIKKEMQDPEMAAWDKLDEYYKEGHRSQIRYMGERLEAYDVSIGLRPVLPNTTDAISELYGPILELLSEIEHERWMRDKKADGWRLGKYDRELKLTPQLVPYDELDDDTKELIRKSLRSLPSYLKEIGYELYTKSY